MASDSLAEASRKKTPEPQPNQSADSAPPHTPHNKTAYLLAPVKFTPTTKTEESSKKGITENEAKQRYDRYGGEIQKGVVGPMPVDSFLEQYLTPVATERRMPKSKGAFNLVPHPVPGHQKEFKEKQVNGPLAEALNSSSDQPRCPGIVFVDTGDRGEDKYGSKPDISAYMIEHKRSMADASYQQTVVEIKLKDFAFDTPTKGKPFLFGHLKSEEDRTNARQGLGQQAYYATEIFARQHRNFLFTIFITPTHARFLRWDRAGVVISTAFEYRKHPIHLCKFLWRFGHMSHAERGGDMTVQMATEAEKKIFKDAIEAHVRAQLQLKDEDLQKEFTRHCDENVVVKIPVQKRMLVSVVSESVNDNQHIGEAALGQEEEAEVSDAVQHVKNIDDDDDVQEMSTRRKGKQREVQPEEVESEEVESEEVEPKEVEPKKVEPKKADPKEIVTFDTEAEAEEFLVSRPVASPLSLASRGTRGYWAVHVKNKTVHFLKDAWRTAVPDMEIEGRILEKLANKGVRNVPTILSWSDVGAVDSAMHSTLTHQYKLASWNKHLPDDPKKVRLTHRVHYRQVTEEAGYTLEQLAGTYELLKGAHDVFEALRDAHTKCNRFHRDVSSSNIILYADQNHQYPERRAILVDWELSCEDVESRARDHWISGTWAFMSINTLSLSQIRRRHHASDDLESLIYVIFYCAVHFLQWTHYDAIGHGVINENFFHQQNIDDTGGVGKRANAADGYIFKYATFEAVSQWLAQSVPFIRKYYGPDTNALAAAVFADYKPIFDREQFYWKDLPKRNREVHKLLYKGPPRDIPRAPTVSSHHTSIIAQEDIPPAKSRDEGSSSKRDLASIEQPVSESSNKRQKTDEEGQEVTTAARRKATKNIKKRSSPKVKAVPKRRARNRNAHDSDGDI